MAFIPLNQAFNTTSAGVFLPSEAVVWQWKSTLPFKPLTLTDYAQFLRDYITKEHITNPVFIGHSFGGRVALKYNELYPNGVSALVLTATPGYTPIPRKKLMLFIYLAKIGKYAFSLPIINLLKDNVRRWYYYLVGARDFYRAHGVMRETFKNIVAEELEESMRIVNIPTLLVWGAGDVMVPVWIGQRMNKTIQGSKLVIIPGSDHGLPFKEPKNFYKAIAPFLKTL